MAVDDEFLRGFIDLGVGADRGLLIAVVSRGLPEHDVADRVSSEHGVEELANLVVLPDKGTLQIRQADLACLHVFEYVSNL